MMSSPFLPDVLHREKSSAERGAVTGILVTGLSLVVAAVVLVFFVFGKIVPPNFIGVRQNYFWPLQVGVQPEGLQPGLQWKIPGVSDIMLIPRDFQFVSFNAPAAQDDFELGPLEVPTRDGSRVQTDISVILRFCEQPGANCFKTLPVEVATPKATSKHTEPIGSDLVTVPLQAEPKPEEVNYGGPRELLNYFTADPQKRFSSVATMAENILKPQLSELTTTDYYNPTLREEAAVASTNALNERVNIRGIYVWGTLIRRYTYVERAIDDQIFNKNLQDQTERMKAAASRLAAAEAKTEEQRALGDAKIRDLEIKTDAQVNVLRSEADLYEARKQAEGDLLVSTARAEVDTARAGALSQVEGAENYVAREMTPLLKTLSGGVVSGIDPFDVNAWVERLSSRNGGK